MSSDSSSTVNDLVDIARSDTRVLQFFSDLARRNRSPSTTKVERLSQYGFRPREGRALCEQLEELGYGDYIIGRRGKSTRFEWSERATDVAQQVIDTVGVSLAALAEVGSAEVDEDDSDIEADDSLLHSYWLRPDLSVEIELPPDLTPDEALRLAVFILTLPAESRLLQNLSCLNIAESGSAAISRGGGTDNVTGPEAQTEDSESIDSVYLEHNDDIELQV